MKNHVSLTAIAGFLLLGCVDKSFGQAAVRDQSFALTSGDEARYSILVPADYDPGTAEPLVVALHYSGEVTPHYARGVIEMLVGPGLHELGAIVVAPDSMADSWFDQKNESMVLELMDFIVENYNIDQNRILLTGFSMGGHGTWHIGSRNQNRFSALIPIAGYPYFEADVRWETPVYAIHSTGDTVVPIEATEKYIAAQKDKGNEQMTLVTVNNLAHYQTSGFAVPLRDAVPWVKNIWAADPVID